MRIIRSLTIVLISFVLLVLMPAANSQEVTPITLSNVELVTLDEASASITWVTNMPADTKVQWGETDLLGYEETISESTNYHLAWISDLTEGTTYYYRVGSGERWSPISSFTTLMPPSSNLEMKFAILTDIHYDIDGRVTPSGMMYADSTRILENAIDELNQDSGLDIVMTLGDLTNGAEVDFNGFAASMNRLSIPWYPVLGNHDKTFANWYSMYTNATGYTDTYYLTNYGKYNLIVMDSAVQGQVSGDIDDEQLAWLESQLDAHAWEPTLIFMHHLIDRTDINGIDPDAQAKINAILEDRPYVLSVHSGHIHQNIVNQGDELLYVSTAATVSYPIGYSKMKLYENGYTTAFYKVEAELEASEESRMGVKAYSGNTNGDEEYLGSIEDRSIVVTVPEKPINRPPVLDSIKISPDSIYTEDSASITTLASDPDGDALDYIYEVSSGRIQGTGESVTYLAPDMPGTYSISVYVSDGVFTSSKKSTEIEVLKREVPQINHAPVIDRISSHLTEVEVGGSVEISIRAVDEDGDVLTYHYDVTDGTIKGEGNRVSWHAPVEPGIYTISVWVFDGELRSPEESITISVYDTGGSISNETDDELPGFEVSTFIASVLILLAVLRYKNK